MILALRKNVRSIVALIVLAAVALGVGAYILAQQGARIPLLSESPVRISAVLDTAQAVTPGQGQTVQVAGVQVGKIAEVELVDGRARLGLDIEPKWIDAGLIRTDARALLRPRTPLKDMYLEVFPGTWDKAEAIGEGFTLPLQNTLSDVNLDEILAALKDPSKFSLPSFDCDHVGTKPPTSTPGCLTAEPQPLQGRTQKFPQLQENAPGGVSRAGGR